MVIDASAVVEFTMGTDRGDHVAEAMSTAGLLFAPSHLFVEVTSAICRLERTGTLTRRESEACMSALALLPIDVVDGHKLMLTAWRHRERFHIADAFYVACALLLQAPLLTCDGRLARGATNLITINHITAEPG